MPNKTRTHKSLTIVLLIIYLVVLTWRIVLKGYFDLSILTIVEFRSINLIPLAGSVFVNGKIVLSEILLNVIAFIPFGVYLSMLNENWHFIKKVLPILFVSLAYETLQYIFAIGATDITDLLANTLGGIIGIGVFSIMQRLLDEKTLPLFNVLATVGTTVGIILLGLALL